MSSAIVKIPTLRARPFPASSEGEEFAGHLSVDVSKNSLFMLTFRAGDSKVVCDIDDAMLDETARVVTFGDGTGSTTAADGNGCARFELETLDAVSLFKEMIASCNDIFHLSLRINTAVRDCFRSGIRIGGGGATGGLWAGKRQVGEEKRVSSKSGDTLLLDALAGFVSHALPKAKAMSDSIAGADSLAVATSEHRPPRAAPKKCFFCQMGEKKYREDHLTGHPYVSCDFKGAPIFMCLKCVSAWKMYRDAAKEADELLLPGEINEELCALCSSLPDTLVMCASCPRSYCECCLSIVIGQTEFRKMKTEEDWTCMECAAPKKKKDIGPADSEPSAACAAARVSEKKTVRAKSPAIKNKSKRRKLVDDVDKDKDKDKAPPEEATPVAVDVLSATCFIPPVAGGKLDEIFYFGQYLNTFEASFSSFQTRSINCCRTAQSRGRRDTSSAQANEESEDYCLLCKDGNYFCCLMLCIIKLLNLVKYLTVFSLNFDQVENW
jgi:hypothetical protein